ncbi:YadA C-terminal domain-containing protein [Haemophilus haemolyticus]|uniref:Putative yadA-like protein n=1 Tax=Haemophilus haemolyticus M19501 TaxID=1028803 RepID=F9GPZ9_HAEHA|nr:YadA C-terminal domain-containing protein [Haemophilus haemolyticus]EGT75181.1 putative yadA-like protein [Haemophilus haemolyticus M19501]
MKKNLLKQSVIAVLVGGAVSGSALAQEINTMDNSGAAFTKGIRNSIVASIQGNSQILNGFKKDEKILAVNDSGNLEERNATEDDVNSDPLKGKGVVNSVLENQAGIKANADTIEFLGEITESNINSLKNRVADNEVDIEDLKTNLTTLGESTNTAVSNLGEYIQNVDQDVAELKETVLGNNGLLDTVDSHTDAIADLQNRNDYRDLNTVRNLVNGTETHLQEHIDNEFSDLVDAVGEIEGTVEKNTSRITDIRNKQLLQNTRLSNHSDRIGANEAAIATNKDNITANKTDIEANAANITAHTQRLDHLDNRVNNLNKDLKRGLAAQAALNGLFQPYNVGKLNLTAAVGGYKSQTAVAVGTGYRYNENIATKAGVAFTRGGSATYNVGVNFEW